MTRAQLTAAREASKRLREHRTAEGGARCGCLRCFDDLWAIADGMPAVVEWIDDALDARSGFDHVGSMS